MPGRKGYAVAALVLVAGFAAAGTFLFGRRLALTIGGTLALAFGSAGLALALAAVTFLRRYRARRRFAAANSAPG